MEGSSLVVLCGGARSGPGDGAPDSGIEVFLSRCESGRKGLLEAASKTGFTGSESEVRHLGLHWEDNFRTIFGLELDGGKARRSRLLGALEGGDEHGVEGTNCFWMIFGVEVGLAGVFGLEVGLPKAKERACSRLLQKVVLRDPKATLDIWACAGRTIFGRFLVAN